MLADHDDNDEYEYFKRICTFQFDIKLLSTCVLLFLIKKR